MSVGRFMLAALSGAAVLLWVLFLAAILSDYGEGQIHWTGVVRGEFLPAYFFALYGLPVLAVVAGYFSLRRNTVTHAQD
jgi:hypothetical protein